MTERPILFSAPMVRAILAGTKTVTRRIIRDPDHHACLTGDCPHAKQSECDASLLEDSPYKPGDRLWVKETWRAVEQPDGSDGYLYAADSRFVMIPNTREAAEQWGEAYANGRHGEKWRPAIFCYRYVSRILLEVVSVRAERLHDITNDDARAEGVTPGCREEHLTHDVACHREAFERLWDELNFARGHGWAANDWVRRVEFRRVEPAAQVANG